MLHISITPHYSYTVIYVTVSKPYLIPSCVDVRFTPTLMLQAYRYYIAIMLRI